jgi:TetR/AcrR family transcriptional regulator
VRANKSHAMLFQSARQQREAELREARRRVILQGARKVFSEAGLDGATIRAIAAAAGCTTGAIYPLFASKEEVYGALLAGSLDQLQQAVAAQCTPQRPAADRLCAGALAFLAYYRDRPDEVTLGLYLWNGVAPRGLSRDLDRALNRRLIDTIRHLEGAIAEMGHSSGLAARHEAAALFAFLIGAIVVHQTRRLGTLKSNLDQITGLHLDALVARLETVGRNDR